MKLIDDFDRFNISHIKAIEYAQNNGFLELYVVKGYEKPPKIQEIEIRTNSLNAFTKNIIIVETYNVNEDNLLILEDKKDFVNPNLNPQIIKLEKSSNGLPISSVEIRNGNVDRMGRDLTGCYKEDSRFLQYELRSALKPPLGNLIKGNDELKVIRKVINKIKEYNRVIAIGDVVTQRLMEEQFQPYLAVYDYKTKREKYNLKINFKDIMITYNPAGMILKETWAALDYCLKMGNMALEVQGEEDLLVLPAIMLSEIGDVILYGQPHEGVVIVEINRTIKEFARDFINKMKKLD